MNIKDKKDVSGQRSSESEQLFSEFGSDLGLDGLRQNIDELDLLILKLLNERASISLEVGRLKKHNALPVFCPEREKEMLQKLLGLNAGPLTNTQLSDIYREIFENSRSLQKQVFEQELEQDATRHSVQNAAQGAVPQCTAQNAGQSAVEIVLPGSKSLSHRMLLAASLASGESNLFGVLESVDISRTIAAMQQLGAKVIKVEDVDFGQATSSSSSSSSSAAAQASNLRPWYKVKGIAGKVKGGDAEPLAFDVHESGTTCRLLTAILAAGRGKFRIFGAERLEERPIGYLTDILESLGASFIWERKPGYPPFVLEGKTLKKAEVKIDSSESSQYLSGLLLAAALGKGLSIIPGGKSVVSLPYALLTLQTLQDFGIAFELEQLGCAALVEDSSSSSSSAFSSSVTVPVLEPASWHKLNSWQDLREITPDSLRITVQPGVYCAGDYQIEPDWSSAGYFLAAAAIGQRPVCIRGLRPDSLQADKMILSILQEMGARVIWEFGQLRVESPPNSQLKGIEVDMGTCPDLVPTVAVLASLAKGKTKIINIGHLRIKESDRISAPATELRKFGCEISESLDTMIITPPKELICPKEVLKTYNDHRIAMSLALFKVRGLDICLDQPDCVSKSFPGFWSEWAKLLLV